MIRNVTGRLPGKEPPKVSGRIPIPASKSHTIRALLIAAFAEGESRLRRPLVSRDSLSCRKAVEFLGAKVTDDGPDWVVRGFGSRPKPAAGTIDVGNSGTTLYLTAALAALSETPVRFDGDEQIRSRSAAPLLEALKAMGAEVESADGGCAPFSVRGPLEARSVTVDCPVSQYLSALLLAAPLILAVGGASSDETALARGAASNLGSAASSRKSASSDENAPPRGDASNTDKGALPAQGSKTGLQPNDKEQSHDSAPEVISEVTTIKVKTLNEAPYVGITLDWLDQQDIRYERDGWNEFRIPAGQVYKPFDRVVPADWSSATFFLVAAAITGGSLTLEGLDTEDSQGDKAVVGMLEKMGCTSEVVPGGLRIEGRPMNGAVLDLNSTPDALPAMAVAACFAEGETRLVNVPQARMKETDRIAVMTSELLKLGVDVEELPDGMVIRGRRPGSFKGAMVDGHDDHRVVMALAVAALGCCGELSIKGAEAADVTFPGFFDLLDRALGRK